MAVIRPNPTALCGSRPAAGYVRFTRWSLRPGHPGVGWTRQHDRPVSLGRYPTRPVPAPDPPSRVGVAMRHTSAIIRSWSVATPTYAGYWCGRGHFSRRLKPASLELTMPPLCQARPVGGLRHASPIPFRASCFTAGLHPPAATAQRHTGCLYNLWDYGLLLIRPFHPRASWRT